MSEKEPTSDVVAMEQMVAQALGGWRGMVDSGLPTLVYVVLIAVTGRDVAKSAIAATAVAVVIAIVRLIQRRTITQVIGGLLAVGISAFIAIKTGNPEDFSLPSVWKNSAFLIALLLGIAFRHPLLGYVVGSLKGDLLGWRNESALLKLYVRLSWLWVGVFALRLAILTPLWQAKAVEALGIAQVALGYPVYLPAVYVTYLMTRGIASKWDAEEAPAT